MIIMIKKSDQLLSRDRCAIMCSSTKNTPPPILHQYALRGMPACRGVCVGFDWPVSSQRR